MNGLISVVLLVLFLIVVSLIWNALERRKNEPIKQALLKDGLIAPVMEYPPEWWYSVSVRCAGMARPCVDCNARTYPELVAVRGEYLVRWRCGTCEEIRMIDVLKIKGT